MTGTCAECGTTFAYRRRGIPATICGQDCRDQRRHRRDRERYAAARASQKPQDGPATPGWRLSAIWTPSEALYGRAPIQSERLAADDHTRRGRGLR